jgi:hypothetical protein
MSIYLRLVDHDALFRKAVNNPIVVNQFDLQSQTDLEKLNGLIYTTYNDDSLEILPRCDCGHVHGEYNVGIRCEECGTECLPVTERPLESALWIAAPTGIDALINPIIWIILSRRFLDGGVNVLEWLTNPKLVVPPEKTPLSIKKLEKMGMTRGLNYFYRNFDSIIDLLINGKVIKNGKLDERLELLAFIKENRHTIFSTYLPFPSKLVFITEKTSMGPYADPTMGSAIEAIRTISSIENSVVPFSERMLEARAIKAITQLAEYYKTFFSKSLGPKEGWFRKHIYGTRGPFTFRAVISSISEPHHWEDVYLPWSLSVMLFKIHLINKLLRGSHNRPKYTPNQALQRIYEGTNNYDPLLDELFQELIREAPNGSIPVVINRNPTLTRGSIQMLNLTRVKTDPEVNTMSVSTLILKAWNADFDGKLIAVVIKLL